MAPEPILSTRIVLSPKTIPPIPQAATDLERTQFTRNYSGIVINQNAIPTGSTTLDDYIYQEFFLPQNYQFGSKDGEYNCPDITGFQILVSAYLTGTFDWKLERDDYELGWQTLATGTTEGVHAEGEKVWADIYFSKGVPITFGYLDNRYRLGIKSSGGVDAVWYVSPNPFVTQAFYSDGTTPLSTGVSLNFRLLAAVTDSGIDNLGNIYRNIAVKQNAELVNTSTNLDALNKFWLSKPNPSKYAIENLYFDISDANGEPTVVDRVLMDPVTPGPYMHVYYSDEGEPGTTEDEWDDKLWKFVPRSYRLDRREELALPEPITAKYICLEFSHLQPQAYTPGEYHKDITYKKHPKWVLDYFILRSQLLDRDTEDPYVPERVVVTYDALEIAYHYYLDDMRQDPDDPERTYAPQPHERVLFKFLENRDDESMDFLTLANIQIELNRYVTDPRFLGRMDYLPTVYALDNPPGIYPDSQVEEQPNHALAQTVFVSSLNRDAIIFEQNYPVMFFYVTSRHRYRLVSASFTHDRAYFVGLREIAFLRDHYHVPIDYSTYIEIGGDMVNVWNSDFLRVDDTWATYST